MWNSASKADVSDLERRIAYRLNNHIDEMHMLNRHLRDELNQMRERQEALIKHLGVKLVFENATKGHWKVERDAE